MNGDHAQRLLGKWRLLRAEGSLDFAPEAGLEFLAAGRLRYSFKAGETVQRVSMVYRIEGDVLFTDNPAAPHARTTRFRFGEGDVLILDFAEAAAWFVREL